jgi:hypothetical protein
MDDINGKRIHRGDLFLYAFFNRIYYGVYKRESDRQTFQFYDVSNSGYEKALWDSGIREKVSSKSWGYQWGRHKGERSQISFIKDNYKRCIKVNENTLSDTDREIYNKIKETLNGNTGSRN